ncbi:MAG TPA: Uma2 family endonuclease [Thermoanaerobaculia bacterium]
MQADLDPRFPLVKPGVSEEEFYGLSEDSDWEYLDGRLVMSPASDLHENLFIFLMFLLRGFLDEVGGAIVRGSRYPMRLDSRWSPEPDLMVIRDERRDRVTRKCLEGPADWVIEIASDSDPEFDIREKLPRYQEAGVDEMWFVDPFARTLRVETRTEGGYRSQIFSTGRVSSAVVPGFWIDAAWLWQEKLPPALGCLQKILG